MGEDTNNDLKQFIATIITQQTSHLTTKVDIARIEQKLTSQHL